MPESFKFFAKMMFEPVAVIAALGAVLLVIRHIKKKREIIFFISFFLIMFLWREFLSVVSRRYFQMLFFPGVLLAAYTICCLIPEKISKCKRKQKIISWSLLTVLLFCCIIKSCRKDYHVDALRSAAASLKNDECKDSNIFCYLKDAQRLAHYSGRDIAGSDILEFDKAETLSEKQLYELIAGKLFFNKKTFLIIKTAGPLVLSAGSGSFNGEISHLELCDKWFLSQKKKSVLAIYRIIPSDTVKCNMLPVAGEVEVPERSSGFEKIIAPGDLQHRNVMEHLKKLNVPEVVPEQALLPSGWNLHSTGVIYPESRVYMSDIKPVSGKYSLVMESPQTVVMWYSTPFRPGNIKISFFVKGTPGTGVFTGMHTYNENHSHIMLRDLLKKRLPDDKLYKIEYIIDKQLFGSSAWFRPLVGVSGGRAEIDNFAIEYIK